MVLPARRVLLQECRNRRVLAQRFEQFALAVGRIDEADAHLLRGKIARLADLLRTQKLAIQRHRRRNGGSGDPEMVEPAEVTSDLLFEAAPQPRRPPSSR